MNQFTDIFGTDLGTITVVAFCLLCFGIIYNTAVSYINRHGLAEGNTWLEVVIGVAVTVAAAGVIIGWQAVMVLLICFAASGLPMAAGDIWRKVQAEQAEKKDREKRSSIHDETA